MPTTKTKPTKTSTHCLSPKEYKEYYQWMWEKSKKTQQKKKCISQKDYELFLKGKAKRRMRDGFLATSNM